MFSACPQAFKRIADICKPYQVGFHTRNNESRFDVEETLPRRGIRPFKRSRSLACWRPATYYWPIACGQTTRKWP